jgi:hypothetical protein
MTLKPYDLLPGMTVTALALVTGIVGALDAGTTAAGRPVLVVTPPWRDAGAVVAAAGGRVLPGVPASSTSSLAFAVSDDAAFDARLHAAGAWLVTESEGLAGLCAAGPSTR